MYAQADTATSLSLLNIFILSKTLLSDRHVLKRVSGCVSCERHPFGLSYY